jgi:hypothetical protein
VVLEGTIKSVAGLAARGWGPSGQKKFDMVVALRKPDGRLRAGLTAAIVVVGEEMKGALLVPRQAVFEQDGKLVVYVSEAAGFEAKDVQVKQRTEGFVAIDGLAEGTTVALVNPEDRDAKGKRGGASAASLAGGR